MGVSIDPYLEYGRLREKEDDDDETPTPEPEPDPGPRGPDGHPLPCWDRGECPARVAIQEMRATLDALISTLEQDIESGLAALAGSIEPRSAVIGDMVIYTWLSDDGETHHCPAIVIGVDGDKCDLAVIDSVDDCMIEVSCWKATRIPYRAKGSEEDGTWSWVQ